MHDAMVDKLIECECALDETAEIAKHCAEYNTKALIDQCRTIKRLAKSVRTLLDKIRESEQAA